MRLSVFGGRTIFRGIQVSAGLLLRVRRFRAADAGRGVRLAVAVLLAVSLLVIEGSVVPASGDVLPGDR